MSMRRLILASTLVLSACATRPTPAPEPAPAASAEPETRRLIGLTAQDLVGHFGIPALQVREGTSLKLQFRGPRCVLDAYLYPQAGGTLRVTYIDTRAPNGVDTDESGCITALETRS